MESTFYLEPITEPNIKSIATDFDNMMKNVLFMLMVKKANLLKGKLTIKGIAILKKMIEF